MVAAVEFDLALLREAASSGAGKVMTAFAVAILAYLLLAAALWLLRPAEERDRTGDLAGFVLVGGLAVYVVVGLLLDAGAFAALSIGVLGLAALAALAGEVRTLLARLRRHAHRH